MSSASGENPGRDEAARAASRSRRVHVELAREPGDAQLELVRLTWLADGVKIEAVEHAKHDRGCGVLTDQPADSIEIAVSGVGKTGSGAVARNSAPHPFPKTIALS